MCCPARVVPAADRFCSAVKPPLKETFRHSELFFQHTQRKKKPVIYTLLVDISAPNIVILQPGWSHSEEDMEKRSCWKPGKRQTASVIATKVVTCELIMSQTKPVWMC